MNNVYMGDVPVTAVGLKIGADITSTNNVDGSQNVIIEDNGFVRGGRTMKTAFVNITNVTATSITIADADLSKDFVLMMICAYAENKIFAISKNSGDYANLTLTSVGGTVSPVTDRVITISADKHTLTLNTPAGLSFDTEHLSTGILITVE